METRTWQCTQCEKKYAEKDARGEAAPVATRQRTNMKIQNRKKNLHVQCLQELRRSNRTHPSEICTRKARNIIKDAPSTFTTSQEQTESPEQNEEEQHLANQDRRAARTVSEEQNQHDHEGSDREDESRHGRQEQDQEKPHAAAEEENKSTNKRAPRNTDGPPARKSSGRAKKQYPARNPKNTRTKTNGDEGKEMQKENQPRKGRSRREKRTRQDILQERRKKKTQHKEHQK